MTLQNVGVSDKIKKFSNTVKFIKAKIKKLSNTSKLIKVRNGLTMILQKVSSYQNKQRNPTRS